MCRWVNVFQDGHYTFSKAPPSQDSRAPLDIMPSGPLGGVGAQTRMEWRVVWFFLLLLCNARMSACKRLTFAASLREQQTTPPIGAKYKKKKKKDAPSSASGPTHSLPMFCRVRRGRTLGNETLTCAKMLSPQCNASHLLSPHYYVHKSTSAGLRGRVSALCAW